MTSFWWGFVVGGVTGVGVVCLVAWLVIMRDWPRGKSYGW